VTFLLRFYRAEDEAATTALWQRAWQHTYPQIDFAQRVEWWRERWRKHLAPKTEIVVAVEIAEQEALIGFVTIDLEGYLDQLVVAPEYWGSGAADQLLEEAMRVSPTGISLLVNTDNARAIRFYERWGFVRAGEDVNPTSGRPVLKMAWRP
jgi:putative acetyltransferase